jgi:hypothetical protein
VAARQPERRIVRCLVFMGADNGQNREPCASCFFHALRFDFMRPCAELNAPNIRRRPVSFYPRRY